MEGKRKNGRGREDAGQSACLAPEHTAVVRDELDSTLLGPFLDSSDPFRHSGVMAEDWKRLGELVREARMQAGHRSTERWAHLVGRSTRVVQGLERGERQGNGTLQRIEAALDWPAGTAHRILAGDQPPGPVSTVQSEVVPLFHDPGPGARSLDIAWTTDDGIRIRIELKRQRDAGTADEDFDLLQEVAHSVQGHLRERARSDLSYAQAAEVGDPEDPLGKID